MTVLQMVGLPADVFEEAKVTAQQADASDTGTLCVPRQQVEVAGGFVAESLSMMANGTLSMRLPPAQVNRSTFVRRQVCCSRGF